MSLRPGTLASFTLVSLALAGTACGNSGDGSGGSGGAGSTSSASSTGSTTSSTSTGMPSCISTSTTDLPGVLIQIDASQCTFSFADPVNTISIAYQVVVDADITGVIPRPQDAGQCDQPG